MQNNRTVLFFHLFFIHNVSVFFITGKNLKTRFEKKNCYLATSSPVAGPRQLCAMDLSFCAVASGMPPPPQYNCRPPPSRQLELQLHGDFHKLTEAAPPQFARSGAGLWTILRPRYGARFRPVPSTTMRFHCNHLKSSHAILTCPI